MLDLSTCVRRERERYDPTFLLCDVQQQQQHQHQRQQVTIHQQQSWDDNEEEDEDYNLDDELAPIDPQESSSSSPPVVKFGRGRQRLSSWDDIDILERLDNSEGNEKANDDEDGNDIKDDDSASDKLHAFLFSTTSHQYSPPTTTTAARVETARVATSNAKKTITTDERITQTESRNEKEPSSPRSSISNRLGLMMSPFKGKKTSVNANGTTAASSSDGSNGIGNRLGLMMSPFHGHGTKRNSTTTTTPATGIPNVPL